MGLAYQRLGDLDRAEQLTRRALAIHRAAGHDSGVATWLRNLGDLAMARADGIGGAGAAAYVRAAIDHYQASLDLRRAHNDPNAGESAAALAAAQARLAESEPSAPDHA
ncbi:MAG: hypothetical protein M5R40_22825 [Anaerolineae bacterium]|nr:hypothetical protein [Anaerolineae bacterium]